MSSARGYHVSPNHTAAPNLILFLTHRRAVHHTFHNCKHFQNKNTSNSEFQVEPLAAFDGVQVSNSQQDKQPVY